MAVGDARRDRLDAGRPGRASRRARHGRDLGQARVREPDRLVQGPDGARDDRRRGTGRAGSRRGRPSSSTPEGARARRSPTSAGSRATRSGSSPPTRLRRRSCSTMGALGADVEIVPEPGWNHARPHPADDASARTRSSTRSAASRPTSSGTATCSTATQRSARELREQLDGRHRCVLRLRRDSGLLRRRHARAPAARFPGCTG